jgi:hypothetical protein
VKSKEIIMKIKKILIKNKKLNKNVETGKYHKLYAKEVKKSKSKAAPVVN